MTGEEDITRAVEAMLGSKGSHESRAIKVSDYQVIWDWEGIETAVSWRWCASLKIWGDDSRAEKCAWQGASSNPGSDSVEFWHCRHCRTWSFSCATKQSFKCFYYSHHETVYEATFVNWNVQNTLLNSLPLFVKLTKMTCTCRLLTCSSFSLNLYGHGSVSTSIGNICILKCCVINKEDLWIN